MFNFDFINIVFISAGLAMDAFSVALSTGFCLNEIRKGHYLRLSLSFGFFQFMMPLLGYIAGKKIEPVIRDYDHWAAFILLSIVGIKMIHEYFEKQKNECEQVDPTCGKRLLILSVATSIDALAVGITFGVMGKAIFVPSVIIGIICALFTAAGVYLGKRFGSIIGKKAEIIGGLFLIAIGVKILLEHLLF